MEYERSLQSYWRSFKKFTFFKTGNMLYKLWFHECNRVYRDRLIEEEDFKSFDTILLKDFNEACPTSGEIVDDLKEPFIFVPFGEEIGDEMPEALIQFKTYDALKKHIAEAKDAYNEASSIFINRYIKFLWFKRHIHFKSRFYDCF